MDWCERGDSNPHGFTRQILSLVRLPIPPLSRIYRNLLIRQNMLLRLPSCLLCETHSDEWHFWWHFGLELVAGFGVSAPRQAAHDREL
jgi:hypothetical protein